MKRNFTIILLITLFIGGGVGIPGHAGIFVEGDWSSGRGDARSDEGGLREIGRTIQEAQ